MRLYVWTLPRKPTFIRWACVAALFTLCFRAPGQNSNAGSNTAQAELHISAIVVQGVFSPPAPEREYHNDQAVVYNLPPWTQQLSISEELRRMQVKASSGVTRQELVRITTVVAK